jgi:hypothetical protein
MKSDSYVYSDIPINFCWPDSFWNIEIISKVPTGLATLREKRCRERKRVVITERLLGRLLAESRASFRGIYSVERRLSLKVLPHIRSLIRVSEVFRKNKKGGFIIPDDNIT